MQMCYSRMSLHGGAAWWFSDNVAVCIFYEGLGYWLVRPLGDSLNLVQLPKNWDII